MLVLILPILMVVMELAVYSLEPRVLSLRNIVNILVQSSYLLLFASAQMVVILTRGFDLSLGITVSAISVAMRDGDDRPRRRRRPGLVDRGRGDRNGSWVRALVGLFNGFFVSWAANQPVRRDAGKPEHLPRAVHHDFGRTAGFQCS